MVVTRRQAHESNATTAIPNGFGAINGSSSFEQQQHQQQHHAADHIVKHHQIPYAPGATPKVPTGVKTKTAPWVYVTLVAFALVTVISYPVPLVAKLGDEPTLQRVFFYGWMTALCTGIGAMPFFLFPDVAEFWVGISNGE
jgi:hypothetical protein